jgi:Flp pilus assembly protein TadD
MRHLAVMVLFIVPPLACATDDLTPRNCAGKASALVVSLQGMLEYDSESKGQWKPITLNQTLCEGSRVHVGSYSRASVLLPNGFVARIDEDTVLTFNVLNPDKPAFMDLLKGFVHFISRTPKHLQINTPIANAGPEGTEFALSVNDKSASLWVYEGGVKFFNTQGSINLKPGQGAQAYPGQAPQARIDIKPQDAVNWALYYPPLLPYPDKSTTIYNDIRTAIENFRQGRTAKAISRLNTLPPEKQTPYFYKVRGAMMLTVGRVDLAQQDIHAILKQNPKDAEALALQSVLMLTQNRKEEAYALAKQSIASNPKSASAYSALSYAEQGRFELDKALQAATQATQLAPHDAMVWARKAELELALGLTSDSEETVQQAEKLDAELERTQTVIGFTHLQQMDADEAMQAFDKALTLDSTSPLARLGLGLAKIRNGDLEQGRQDLEIAAILDPNNSLIRSYLGKAYYEEKRNPLAEDQFKLAKERDPKDPTPYFYDALKKQTENRPVEALHDLQTAMDLNDNRAVYRSKQLLDSDLAARGASLARIYDNLGFQQRGVVEAISSLQTDPTNYSAHRFLSDTYVNQPGRETAQLSELLQAKMLQPININPVQPHLSVSQRVLLNASGIANSSFQDFTRVFERNRPQLLFSGIAGNMGTFGDESTLSGIFDNLSYSLGQFHYETDGFIRPYGPAEYKNNTAQKHDIYNMFLQWKINETLNTQFEYNHRETDQGSLQQTITSTSNNFSERNTLTEDNYRIGFNVKFSQNDLLLGSYIHTNSETINNSITSILLPFQPTPIQEIFIREFNNNINIFESQYHHIGKNLNFILGTSVFNNQEKQNQPLTPKFEEENSKTNGHREYIYINTKLPFNISNTFGVALDYANSEIQGAQSPFYPKTKLLPKFGILWEPLNYTKFRFAYAQEIKRPIEGIQTLEPTQLTGFNQFYDDRPDTIYSLYGGAIDLKLNTDLSVGFELSRREVFNYIDNNTLRFINDTSRAYLYWTPINKISISTNYIFSRKKEDIALFNGNSPNIIDTHILPLELRFFSSNGLFYKLTGTYVNQDLSNKNIIFENNKSKISSNFFLVDAAIGLRLPKQLGIISLETKNLLDKRFRFEDLRVNETNPFYNSSQYIPGRAIFGRFTLNF